MYKALAMRIASALAALGCALSSSCIIEAPTAEGVQPSRVSAPAPPVEVRSGANFGDKVELVSAILNPPRAAAGDNVHVSLVLRVMDKIDRDYMIFVHVEDVEGRVDRLNVDHNPRAKPTSQWQPGELIRDDFDISIPPGMPVKGLNLILGFWDARMDQRLAVKNASAVRTDGRDRVFVATIPVSAAQ